LTIALIIEGAYKHCFLFILVVEEPQTSVIYWKGNLGGIRHDDSVGAIVKGGWDSVNRILQHRRFETAGGFWWLTGGSEMVGQLLERYANELNAMRFDQHRWSCLSKTCNEEQAM